MTDLPTDPTPEKDVPLTVPGESLFHLADDAGLMDSPDDPPEDDALWISDDLFGPALSERPVAVRPPGPGLPESIAWIVGVIGMQFLGMIVAVGIFAATEAMAGRGLSVESLQRLARDQSVMLFAVIQVVSVIGISLAAFLRLGRDRARMLPLRRIPWQHLVIIFVAVLPMVALASQLHVAGSAGWKAFTDLIGVSQMDELSSMKAVTELGQVAPWWALMLMIAVAPAIAEELVFRGVIGRGMIARWGMPVGIGLTTLMFAAMHVHPPHVFALLPLSVYMHLIYQASRSFWAPMLVHFLNNGLSVVVLKVALETGSLKEMQEADQGGFSVVMFLCSAFSVVTILVLTWKTRVQFLHPDGTEWSPGYAAVEHPPDSANVERRCHEAGLVPWLMAAAGLGVFFAGALVVAVVKQQTGWSI